MTGNIRAAFALGVLLTAIVLTWQIMEPETSSTTGAAVALGLDRGE